ncbi:MAG: hypothetical protein M3352_12295 [Bacteroidota bacterium]|nr:hypothetical protein [Bacteroidota bacterium]
MIKYFVFIFTLCISINLWGQHPFLQNLQSFCGKSYEGKTIFPLDAKDPFAGKRLSIHFQKCEERGVRIPFFVGEDSSRTWVLTIDSIGLLLKHDHRHKDGTPDSITLYGGYAKASQNKYEQFFPADPYTAKLIPAAATNEWNFVLSRDRKKLSYILRRDGKLRFHADFDLTRPVNK